MSVIKYKIGELVLVSPLIFDHISSNYGIEPMHKHGEYGMGSDFYDSRKRFGVITEIEDTLDVWYSKQDKYKHTYTVLTTTGEVKRYFSHELEPVENTKYYAK